MGRRGNRDRWRKLNWEGAKEQIGIKEWFKKQTKETKKKNFRTEKREKLSFISIH